MTAGATITESRGSFLCGVLTAVLLIAVPTGLAQVSLTNEDVEAHNHQKTKAEFRDSMPTPPHAGTAADMTADITVDDERSGGVTVIQTRARRGPLLSTPPDRPWYRPPPILDQSGTADDARRNLADFRGYADRETWKRPTVRSGVVEFAGDFEIAFEPLEWGEYKLYLSQDSESMPVMSHRSGAKLAVVFPDSPDAKTVIEPSNLSGSAHRISVPEPEASMLIRFYLSPTADRTPGYVAYELVFDRRDYFKGTRTYDELPDGGVLIRRSPHKNTIKLLPGRPWYHYTPLPEELGTRDDAIRNLRDYRAFAERNLTETYPPLRSGVMKFEGDFAISFESLPSGAYQLYICQDSQSMSHSLENSAATMTVTFSDDANVEQKIKMNLSGSSSRIRMPGFGAALLVHVDLPAETEMMQGFVAYDLCAMNDDSGDGAVHDK